MSKLESLDSRPALYASALVTVTKKMSHFKEKKENHGTGGVYCAVDPKRFQTGEPGQHQEPGIPFPVVDTGRAKGQSHAHTDLIVPASLHHPGAAEVPNASHIAAFVVKY